MAKKKLQGYIRQVLTDKPGMDGQGLVTEVLNIWFPEAHRANMKASVEGAMAQMKNEGLILVDATGKVRIGPRGRGEPNGLQQTAVQLGNAPLQQNPIVQNCNTLPANLAKLEGELSRKRLWKNEETRAWVWDAESLSFRKREEFIAGLDWPTVAAALKSRRAKDPDTSQHIEDLLYEWATTDASAVPWETFERTCKILMRKLGFHVQHTKRSHDNGVDLFATDDALLRPPHRYVVSCKRKDSIGVEHVRELDSVVRHHGAERGILLTTGKCTREAHCWAEDCKIQIIDGYQLEKIMRHQGEGGAFFLEAYQQRASIA